MVVGQFSESMPPIMDGVGLVAFQYACWLDRKYGKAVAVTVRVPGHADDPAHDLEVLRVPSVPIRGMPPYRAPIPVLATAVRRRLRELAFDVVHAHAPFVLGRLALRIARSRGIPIVATLHSKYHADFEKALPTKRLQDAAVNSIVRFYDRVDEVWVPNQATVATMREYGYEGPVHVIGNGTDLEVPADIDACRRAGAARARVTDDQKMLLYIGQHRWEKNLKLLLESLKVAKTAGARFRMVFVGQGYAEQELRALSDSLGLHDEVVFLGVIRDREAIKQLYARCSLFLFPSLYDTSPLTLREAAVFGVPTVLVKGASATEGIEDGMNGFLAENTAEAFGRRIARALADDGLRRTVGEGAHATLFRRWEDVADEVHARYTELIDRRRHS